VLIHARCDERMRHLHEERGGPAEQEEALPVDASRDAIGREDAAIARSSAPP
jgi:hypothetical protein